MWCLGTYPGVGACLCCYCTEVHYLSCNIKLYNYTIEHDKSSRAESDGTFGETSNDESEPGILVTTEPKQKHIGFRQSQEKTSESNSPGLEDNTKERRKVIRLKLAEQRLVRNQRLLG